MKILINEVDVSNSGITVRKCEYTDNAGGRADALSVVFNDEKEEWRGWNLKKGDTIQICESNIDTGVMFVSRIQFVDGGLFVKALSTPIKAKNEYSSVTNDIRFIEELKNIANEIGFELFTYDIENPLYKNLVRVKEETTAYAQRLCEREGCLLKIYNKKMIVYSEKVFENKKPFINIKKEDFVERPTFGTNDLCVSKIHNLYLAEKLIDTIVKSNIDGREIETNIACSDIGESERFSKNRMRIFNKMEYIGEGKIADDKVSAGVTINLDGNYGEHSGTNFIYKVVFDLVNGTQKIYFRKSIKGEY